MLNLVCFIFPNYQIEVKPTSINGKRINREKGVDETNLTRQDDDLSFIQKNNPVVTK